MSAQDSFVGQMIGSYRLLDKLGEGGMGAVYLGMHVGLLHEYAIKVLPKKHTESREAVKRFMREAQRAGELDHPNIVPVIHFGLEDNKYYMVMVRVDGQSLKQVLRRHAQARQPIPLVDAVCWARQAAMGLAYAHSRGIIHRDVKPDNLLLGRDGLLRIADFGLARRVENEDLSITQTQQILGTPMYMPLEQWSAESVDQRADIYALGATLYHLLCGEPPILGKSAVEILRRRMDNRFDRPRRRRSEISPQLEAAMLAMIERDAADRPRDMDRVLRMLDEACPAATAAAERALAGLAGEEAEASGESSGVLPAGGAAGVAGRGMPAAAMHPAARPATIDYDPEPGTVDLSYAEAAESAGHSHNRNRSHAAHAAKAAAAIRAAQRRNAAARTHTEREPMLLPGSRRVSVAAGTARAVGESGRAPRRRLYRRFAATMTASIVILLACAALWWYLPPPGWDLRPYMRPLFGHQPESAAVPSEAAEPAAPDRPDE